MRVVAGVAKGRKLTAPDGDRTRPTSDRVREAIFNALFSLDDAVTDARVVDLFAGTGALGIEALSRGATSVTFVERDRRALAALEHNLSHTALGAQATVVRADALDWLAAVADGFDLALCDPPYDFAAWSELLARLPSPLAVLESDRPLDTFEGWEVVRTRRYGGTVVSIVRRRGSGVTAREQP
jgi:16S rRNA (guanine966-N2)-methyltransferase